MLAALIKTDTCLTEAKRIRTTQREAMDTRAMVTKSMAMGSMQAKESMHPAMGAIMEDRTQAMEDMAQVMVATVRLMEDMIQAMEDMIPATEDMVVGMEVPTQLGSIEGRKAQLQFAAILIGRGV
ncbi:hypothetical protein CAPTEDRAFT_202244 [Capitella teleta]|uniref:Uncharacterized protein n=1 Tax=Capitella teleta TaxID=283909 RepID=R7UU16_CAPTE|nr:hypothetical protein CAPTEDRAFT_202244 [Capitella teleta]|eukprot:ELU09633.1 hypothetical protein CAPTEDRAFT_202244 [Capitella teleta]